ncbi:MAG: stage II sporulation protein R [Clostridia bacterium]|nr:stage II sporulation protein R [Clostridia bacterium]
MKRKIKYIFILILLLFCFILTSISSYASTVSQNLSSNFFRLHILANSDSKLDQDLKLKVRDAIIEHMNSQSFSNTNKSEVINSVRNNLEIYKQIAEDTIEEAGFYYPVSIEIGNFYFPTKIYGNISLPAGYYDALRIKIGNAEGQNWWCSLFPPLCFVDISSGIIDEESKENLKENLSEEEFAIITNNSETIKLKFKILEIFSN